MPICAVYGCNEAGRDRTRKVTFHRFPRDIKIRRTWVIRCSRADKLNFESARICSKHFSEEDYCRLNGFKKMLGYSKAHNSKLANGVIPSRNLPGRVPGEDEDGRSARQQQRDRRRRKRPAYAVMEDAGLPPPVLAESADGGEDGSSSSVVQDDADIKFQPSVKIETMENELFCPKVGMVSAPEECPESDSLEWTCSEVKCKEEDEDEEDKFQSPVKMEAGEDEYILPDVGTMSAPEGCPESDPLELTCSEVECEEEDVPVLESPLSEDLNGFTVIDLNKTCKPIAKDSVELAYFGDESARVPNVSAQPCTETAEQAGPSSSGGGKVVSCLLCDYRCLGPDDLKIHVTTQHGHIDSTGRYKCELCPYSTNYESNLTHHRKRHAHRCDVCGKTFAKLSELTIHYRVHTGERPYKCDVCGKTFTEVRNLRSHWRVHTDQKPYKCDICEKGFTEKSRLTNHRLIHTGMKIPQCSECGASFSQVSNYIKHMKSHSVAKLLRCEVCAEQFVRRSALSIHMQAHWRERPYACAFCPARFVRQADMRGHVTRLHTHRH